jgi:hypothetical protein
LTGLSSSEWNEMITATLLAVIVFLPQGLWSLFRRRKAL